MSLRPHACALAAILLAAWTPAFAQQTTKSDPYFGASKEVRHERMRSLAQEIDKLRSGYGSMQQVAQLEAEYQAISRSLGGDQPARESATPGFAPVASGGQQLLAAPTCGSAASSTASFAGTTGPIAPPQPYQGLSFTAAVSGLGTYLWDVNLTTFITHTFNGDNEIYLKSPAGTEVAISTRNGGASDNVFNGTVWDDNVNIPCTDYVYTNNVTVPTLSPEGRLQAFRGEDPNGTWTLRIADMANLDVGNLNGWSLDITTLAGAPIETTTTITSSPALPLADNALTSTTMVAGGLGTYLDKVVLYVEVQHTNCTDLDLRLVSPAGTSIDVSTDNGGTSDNVFNGTSFDPDVLDRVTDHVYVNLTAVALLSSEGSFDNFLGQDPNGTWTLAITDDLAANVGTLVRWDLSLTTTSTPSPSAPANFAGTTGALPDNPGTGLSPVPTTFTTTVSGMGPYLWDVDLNTFIQHTSAADIDMTLTSPAGTVVTISTDNGGVLDDVFNGTQWDDNVNDIAMEHVYTNMVTASPLSPEGRLGAFRGEDPNGVWTLTVSDDVAADNGSVNGWSLDVATLASAPGELVTVISQSPGLFLADYSGAPVTTSDTMVFAGLEPFLTEVELYVEITHTYANDIRLFLTSPAGTVITLSNRNGGANDNVYNGTLFDNDNPEPATDHLYANLVTAPLLAPSGPFDNFLGQDPNGVWTLSSTDNAGIDTGTLVRWDLTIKTCLGAGSAFCSNGTLGGDHTTPCPCGNTGLPGNGCAHSFSADGANLSANGSSGADTVQLVSINEPNTAFTLFMQHTAPADVVFHDGVLCAGGTLLRLRGRGAVGGQASFPNPMWDSSITLSQRGSVTIGSGTTRYYGAWYRNASTTFCPPATANVSNGWVITW